MEREKVLGNGVLRHLFHTQPILPTRDLPSVGCAAEDPPVSVTGGKGRGVCVACPLPAPPPRRRKPGLLLAGGSQDKPWAFLGVPAVVSRGGYPGGSMSHFLHLFMYGLFRTSRLLRGYLVVLLIILSFLYLFSSIHLCIIPSTFESGW